MIIHIHVNYLLTRAKEPTATP